jgi:hypothetical protein
MKQRLNNQRLLNVILVLALIVLGLFCIKSCNRNKTLIEEASLIMNYQDTVLFYKSKNGDLISYNKALEISSENLKVINKELYDELEDLKMRKPKVVTKIVTEVEIREIPVPYEVQLPCDSFNVPFSFNDTWVAIGGRSKHTGLFFDSIVLTNDMTIAVGEKDNGLFKRNEYIVAVKSDNPYFNTKSLKSYTFKPKEPFYNQWWFKASIFTTGFAAGVLVK